MRISNLVAFTAAVVLHLIVVFLLSPNHSGKSTLVNSGLIQKNPTKSTGIDISGFKMAKLPTKTIFSAKNSGLNHSLENGEAKNQINSPTNEEMGSTVLPNNQTISISQYIAPDYPRIARARGIEGKVTFIAYYGLDGVISKFVLVKSSGHTTLDESVKNAVLKWKVTPGSIGQFEKTIEFKLK